MKLFLTFFNRLYTGGVTKGSGTELKAAQQINLIGGTLAAGSAAQASDVCYFLTLRIVAADSHPMNFFSDR